jgi:hypothetical protein
LEEQQHDVLCGTKLICIAKGTFYPEPDERLIKEQLEKSEKWKKAWQEKIKSTFSSHMDVEYLMCGTCKALFMGYGTRGYYMDYLGSLTDEAVALLVAGKLKEKE